MSNNMDAMLTDEASISGNSSGSKDYDKNINQPVQACIQYGGGKRGHSGKDDAEDRSRRCAEEVRAFLMRVQASGASGHAVSCLCNDLETCVNISKTRPEKVFSELLATLDKNNYRPSTKPWETRSQRTQSQNLASSPTCFSKIGRPT